MLVMISSLLGLPFHSTLGMTSPFFILAINCPINFLPLLSIFHPGVEKLAQVFPNTSSFIYPYIFLLLHSNRELFLRDRHRDGVSCLLYNRFRESSLSRSVLSGASPSLPSNHGLRWHGSRRRKSFGTFRRPVDIVEKPLPSSLNRQSRISLGGDKDRRDTDAQLIEAPKPVQSLSI